MRFAFALFLLGCGNHAWDMACYSGGALVWKGTATELKAGKAGGVNFTDSNGVDYWIQADCFASQADAK